MITIQLLDYVYGSDTQNLVDVRYPTLNGSASYRWEVLTSTAVKIANQTSGTKYLSPVSGKMTKGVEYKISATVSGYTGTTGYIGFSSVDSSGATNGVGTSARRNNNGSISHTFTASGNQDIKIFSASNGGGTLSALRLRQVSGVQWHESVVGTLDVGSSEDFPLALTFSISEVRDITARTGTYSKTFNIPATKNNNRVLKYVYDSGSAFGTRTNSDGFLVSKNKIYTQKPCRILIDDAYSLTGFFELTSVFKGDIPSHYSCVFYGNNVDWATSLDKKALKDLAVLGGAAGSGWDNLNYKGAGTGSGLQVNEPSITATWATDNAKFKTPTGGVQSANTSPIVYPMAGYGEYNPGGDVAMPQLLKTAYAITGGAPGKIGYYGHYDNGDSYNTPIPCVDWRPGIFIYDIIHQMFAQEGYKISSNFIESDMFKTLIMLLPNFRHGNAQERVDANSFKGEYRAADGPGIADEINPSQTSIGASTEVWKTYTLRFDDYSIFHKTLNTSMYDNANGFFTIQEYGFYDINIENFSIWVKTLCYDAAAGGISTATRNDFYYIRMFLEVQTAGQTGNSSWVRMATAYAKTESSTIYYYSCPAPPNADKPWNFENILLENQWLNKNDKIRFRIQYKMGHGDSGTQDIQWNTFIYGGTDPTGGYPSGTSDTNGQITITHHGEKVEYGQTFDLKNVIDTESNQLQFLKGVIHAFNLQLTTDADSKTVYIEPFNDFYKEKKDAIDWTGRVDLSKKQEDKWVPGDLKNEVIFKYKSDSKDEKVQHRGKTYWDNIMDESPYREFLSSEFADGTSVFENPFFAGTYCTQDGMTSGTGPSATSGTPVRALLWGLCQSGALPTSGSSCRPEKGYDFVPRLCHWRKYDCSSGFNGFLYYSRLQWWAFWNGQWWNPWVVSGANANYEYQQFGTAESYNRIQAKTLGDPATHTPPYSGVTKPLTYASIPQVTWDCTTSTHYDSAGYKGLYQEYYQNMIEMLKRSPRIKLVYVNLKMSDIANLDLRKLVYIDGYYYRINRVIDYQVNNNNPTQVELVLWEDLGGFPVDTAWKTS